MPPKFTKAMDPSLKRAPSPSRAFASRQADCYARDLYNKVETTLLNRPSREISATEDLAEAPKCMPMIWITKWVLDYSDKYGIGYQLCDNSVGVLFNDNSRLVLDAAQQNLQYVEQDNFEEYYVMNKDTEKMIHLTRKITLLRFFLSCMGQPLINAGDKFAPKEGDELARLPYLHACLRTQSALVFHLTNGTLQIINSDHTKLILCPHLDALTVIDLEKRSRTFKLELLRKHGFGGELGACLRQARREIETLMQKHSIGGDNMSTSVKHREFVSEPMGEKEVEAIAGISPTYGERLREKGFDKAYVVFGQFLLIKKDEQLFIEWLKVTAGITKNHATNCYNCLNEWAQQYI